MDDGKTQSESRVSSAGELAAELDPAFGFDLDDESWVARLRGLPGEVQIGRLGPYELLGEIGRGGQGVVYKARQPRTGRVIALKRVAAGGDGSASFRRRFEREIRTGAALNHPNIVTIFGCDTVDGQALLLMEFIDGQPVDRWVESLEAPGEPGRTAAVVALFEKLCRAVAHAHQHGVIHRDLKPSNVLVVEGREQGTEVGGQRSEVRDQTTEDAGAHSAFRIPNSAFTDSAIRNPQSAIPKVLDFGLARLLSPYVNESLFQTHTTGFVGTPAYASPEHFADDGAAVDVRSDIYAVGVMLYQALTGSLPYDGKLSFSALMKAIQERDPPRPSSFAPGLPRELELIVLKALSKEKDRRYQSMDAMADDLRRFAAGETVLAHPPTAGYQLRKLIRRHKVAFAFSVMILLLVAGSAVLATVLGLRERAARQDADLNSYVASLAAASVAIRADDAASAQHYLETAPSKLRNWEWRYFQAQADQSISTQAGCKEALAVDGEGRPVLWQTGEGVRWSGEPGQVQAILAYNHAVPRWIVSPSLRYLLMIKDDGPGRPLCLCTLSDLGTGRLLARWRFPENDAVVFAPDDRTLVSTDGTGNVDVLRLPLRQLEKQRVPGGPSSGPLLLTDSDFERMRIHDSNSPEVAFSPDGRRLATPGGQGRVKIVDVDRLETLQIMEVGERPTRALAFSPDGRTLAVGSVDKRVSHWDVASGRQLWVSTGHVELISDVAFSPDGSRIASGSWDKSIRIWDSSSGACVGRLLGHQAGIERLAFLGDGDRLVSVDRGGTLKNWLLSNLRPSIAAGKYRRVLGIAESPKATKSGWLAICESTDDTWRNSRVSVIDLRERRMKGVLWTDEWIGARGRGADVYAVEISRDGRWLATGGEDGVLRLWRGEDLAAWVGNGDAAPQPARQLEVLVEGEHGPPPLGERTTLYPESVSFDPTGQRLAVGRANGALEVWDINRGESVINRPASVPLEACLCTFSPDGTRLAVHTWGGLLQIIRADDSTLLCERTDRVEGPRIRQPVFSPDGALLAVSSDGNDIVVRRAGDLEIAATLKGHADVVWDVAFSPDGTRLVSAGQDYKLKVWDTETWHELATLHGHEMTVTSVRFIDDDTIVSGSQDNTIRFWDAAKEPEN